jgi:hypothetical protein
MPPGRPSKFKEEYNEQVTKLCLLGATDKEIADFFNVDEATINNWKKSKEGFFESLKKGKLIADANVGQALYHRACGYHHLEDKIFNNGEGKPPTIIETTKHYPPDTAAAFIWLKNRRPESWRDKTETVSEVTLNGDRLYEKFSAAIRDAANVTDPTA